MAVLTTDDFRSIRAYYYRKGYGKEELRDKLLPRDTTKAVFQAIEDEFIASCVAAMKSAAETAKGSAMTNAEFKVYGTAWLDWKARNNT